MYRIRTLNNISGSVREVLSEDEYVLGDAVASPDALFVRATDLHGYDFNPELLCLGQITSNVLEELVLVLTVFH